MPEAGQIPFEEAIDFLKGKVNLPTRRFDDLQREAHARAFSVAGVTRDDMLADFRRAIEKAVKEGTGYNEFRKDFDAIVDRTGWSFKARGSTEEARRAWRARIIYVTNMRTSYMAGRYKQLTDPDALAYRPYWQYIHSGALHPRKVHLALDRKVFRADDPIWNIYFPPNGWGCGCDVKALSKRDMARIGKEGPDDFPLPGPYEGKDPRTGDPETRYPGVDRGWEYNAGKDWLQGPVPQELREPLKPFESEIAEPVSELPPLPEPHQASAAEILPEDAGSFATVSAFLSAFGLKPGEAREFRDASGGLITVSERLFDVRDDQGTITGDKSGKNARGRFIRLIAMAIIEPDEIWADWVKVTSGVALRRAYLKRFLLPDRKRSMFVRFEWTAKGWTAITGFDTRETYITKSRTGALLWRKG